jgi:hypothetical protein
VVEIGSPFSGFRWSLFYGDRKTHFCVVEKVPVGFDWDRRAAWGHFSHFITETEVDGAGSADSGLWIDELDV